MRGEWAAAVLLAATAVVVTWPGQRIRRLHAISPTTPEREHSWRPRHGHRRTAASAGVQQARTVTVASALATACLGALLGGPVAAAIAGTYGGLAMVTVLRRRAAAAAAQERVRRLDHLGALAADLRAGLPPPSGPALDTGPQDRLVMLANAAVRLAERTGAPLADLVERIEADARAMDRAIASATAQAAGVRATAWLLAGLPLGGIALGYGIGVDPLNVLLHTPVGAACAVAAIVLQLAGLAWAERLSSGWARRV